MSPAGPSAGPYGPAVPRPERPARAARRPRVTVVQPYITGYRAPFLARLGPVLAARGIDLTVAHGRPAPRLAARGDAVRLPGACELPQRDFEFGGRTVMWRDLGALRGHSDVLILEQALHNLESLPPLLRPGGGPAVALWGHGTTYNARHGQVLDALKRRMTRRARWFFAYTEGGARAVAAAGFPGERITVVRNTIDTDALVAARDAVTGAEADAFRRLYGLTPGRTGLYIGALDRTKRVGFLLDAADRLARELPGFRLLIAGDGPDRDLVERVARERGVVVYGGRTAGDVHKALVGAVSDVLLVPGQVGLVAVDSFALRTPVVTTAGLCHGPEFDYLRDGENARVVDGGIEAYVRTVAELLADPARLRRLSDVCRTDAAHYTIGGMAERFAQGVEQMVGNLPTFASCR
ncbi:glycosyltransferase [Streptomyces sp. NPDC087440]|uniref:glycosyltransferase n=1 Tax=Streptomyces sp. NPDC087440 TaxID=3365790 RepID=UPI003805B9B6